ncbi:MAG TPA: mandelate racemase/muconate lactonizing enzyme family protein [Chloroflexota bacterium]|nr:mandelate racemase/muconate lactonizing enzyme family protein [Chloroflexota bacterium]
MKVTRLEPIIVSIPYRESEHSTRVQRDGVTDVIVRLETDTGLVGWGESCSGANVESIAEAVKAAIPIVIGRDPWNTEAIAADFFGAGLWDMRPMTGNFAYAGIDMALWDLCGQACDQPLYNLFGGLRRRSIDYMCYLKQAPPDDVARQCRVGLEAGCSVFYLKVGLNVDDELPMVEAIRQTAGPSAKIRIDANGAWSVSDATRYLATFDRFRIDFAEAPVRSEPLRNMVEIRTRTPVAICANEGLGRISDVWEYIRSRAADVLCFSPYWVGSLAAFHRLAHAAQIEGINDVKHTHGEFGIAATACQHLLLTLPNLVDGNQQVAFFMADDVLTEPLPIARRARWDVPTGTGLGLRVDEEKVLKYHRLYEEIGQFLPYKPEMLARETRDDSQSSI